MFDYLGGRFGNTGANSPHGGYESHSIMTAGGAASDNTAHLKGKLSSLNETIRQLQE